MSGSFESVQWNACVHILGIGLYSNLKSFEGMESEPMLAPRENPFYRRLRGDSNPQRCIMQNSEPYALPTEQFRLSHAVIREAIWRMNILKSH